MDITRTINLCDIKVPEHFLMPKLDKLIKKTEYYINHSEFESSIVLCGDTLVDGYTTYLIASMANKVSIQCVDLNPLYATCVFENCPKEYVWRIPEGHCNINIGDYISVKDVNGKKTKIKVCDLFYSNDPELYFKHKQALRK